MHGHNRSLRNIINYILVVMGIFALALVWYTMRQYQVIVIDEQRNAMTELASHVSAEQLTTHERYLVDLGLTMQAGKKFRTAFNTEEKTTLHSLVADQFHQYFTTTGLVELERITIYDTEFEVISRVSADSTSRYEGTICPALIEQARSRSGVARNKPISGLCNHAAIPYHVAIVPIGGLILQGYAAIIADPSNTLEQISNLPGMPYSLLLPNGERLFTTRNWPARINEENTLSATHTIMDMSGNPLLIIEVSRNITNMNQRLNELVTHILILTLTVTLIIVLLARRIFQKRIVLPLMRLNQHMSRVQNDQEELGKNVEISGCIELDKLSQEFNSMARKLVEAQDELRSRAQTDTLTGLPNRDALYQRLEQLTSQHRRTGKPFSFLMLDLDKFKEVNDTMGHHTGDEVIRLLGNRLSASLRASDTVARLGGDEFAILLPTTEKREDAANVAKKILEECAHPFVIDDNEVTLGISIGIALFPDTADDTDHLLRCADKSMYQAKQAKSGYFICEIEQCRTSGCYIDFCAIPRLPDSQRESLPQ